MKTFLLIGALAVLFVLGPMLAMRPSPRQAQLARLRARATGAGLRVRLGAARAQPASADYVLPWQLQDPPELRRLRLAARRGEAGGWECDARNAFPAAVLGGLLDALPPGVAAVTCVDEGLAAQWNEKGPDTDVERIDAALRGIREALRAGCGRGAQLPEATDIRT